MFKSLHICWVRLLAASLLAVLELKQFQTYTDEPHVDFPAVAAAACPFVYVALTSVTLPSHRLYHRAAHPLGQRGYWPQLPADRAVAAHPSGSCQPCLNPFFIFFDKHFFMLLLLLLLLLTYCSFPQRYKS